MIWANYSLSFDDYGPENTESVIEAVSKKIDDTGIRTVVLASSSGQTAIKFARKLEEKADIIAVSWRKMPTKNVNQLKDMNVKICNFEDYLPLHKKGMDQIRNTLYLFGQGMKVCVEVALIAVDKGMIAKGQEVITVSGTDTGADTAAIIKATSTDEMLGPKIEDRLEVREVFALPRKKKWWE